MKRRIYALQAACAVLLAACAPTAAAPEASPTPETEITPEPPSTMPDPTAVPASAETAGTVEMEVQTEEREFSDETDPQTVLLSFSAQLPSVTIPGGEAAALNINESLRHDYELFVNGEPEPEEGVLSGVDAYLTAAKEDRAYWLGENSPQNFVPFILWRQARMTRGDSRVVSVVYDDTAGVGGVHPSTWLLGRSFDARTGERLALSGLAEDPDGFLAACGEKLLEISRDGDHADYMYFDDYEETLPRLLEGDAWYFDDRGIVIVADPYDIAPYAYGQIDFLLPYDWLAQWIGAEYLPA